MVKVDIMTNFGFHCCLFLTIFGTASLLPILVQQASVVSYILNSNAASKRVTFGIQSVDAGKSTRFSEYGKISGFQKEQSGF